jgi:hypothetical protein
MAGISVAFGSTLGVNAITATRLLLPLVERVRPRKMDEINCEKIPQLPVQDSSMPKEHKNPPKPPINPSEDIRVRPSLLFLNRAPSNI